VRDVLLIVTVLTFFLCDSDVRAETQKLDFFTLPLKAWMR
jgi:hypothetical protein